MAYSCSTLRYGWCVAGPAMELPPTSQTIGAMHLVVNFKGYTHQMTFGFLRDTTKPPHTAVLINKYRFFYLYM